MQNNIGDNIQMKYKVKNLVKIFLFIAVFIAGLLCLYRVFKWKDTNGPYLSTFDSLYALDNNTVDVVFAGPSYTYQTMNPATYWDDYGISAFTMSISGQDKNSTVASIREVLKTQTPDIVMIDASGALFDKHAIQGNLYRNTISMKLSANSIALVNKSIDPEDRMDYILRWPIIHTRYKELQKYDFEQYNPSIYSMGYNYLFTSFEREASLDAFLITDEVEVSETNKAWVSELSELSEQYKFELIFYLTPGVAEGEARKTINGFESYLKENDITFIDYNKTPVTREIDYEKDFVDYCHMNYYGSEKIIAYTAEYLKSNYEIADHRGESGYDAWNEAVAYKKQVLLDMDVMGFQNTEYDSIVELANKVATADNLIMVVSLEGDFMHSSCNIVDALDVLGINVTDYEHSAAYIIENKTLTRTLTNSEVYRIKVNSADTMQINRIVSNTNDYVTNVSVGLNYYRNDPDNIDGMYMFIYDTLTDKVIFNVSF